MPSKNESGTPKWWITVSRMILRPSCTTRSQLSPKMANQPSVISLICMARLLMWDSVMETHSRLMPCTSVTVSKYGCYCILCYTFHLACISVALEIIHVPENSLRSLLIRALPKQTSNLELVVSILCYKIINIKQHQLNFVQFR